MIRDRGSMKWTAMMLPEHVKLLRDWAEEDTYEQRVILDEQQLEEMNQLIGEALEYQTLVAITYYEKKRYQLLIGYIHYYDEYKQRLHIIDQFEEVHYLKLSDLIDARTV